MKDVTVPTKTGKMVDKFINTRHTFGSDEVDNKLKGQLQDLMGWGDIIVVDHSGVVKGISRKCAPLTSPQESPLTVGYKFDSKYDEYLKFAHHHDCVMVVRAGTEDYGICVFSHEELNNEVPK